MKISITGSFGVGKTTLANILQEKINIPLLPEVARILIKQGHKMDKGVTPDLEYIMAKMQEELENGKEWIADRCFIDLYAYIKILFPKHVGLNYEILSFLQKSKYDFIFYLPIEFPIENDGERSVDVKFQKKIDREIKKIIKEFFPNNFYKITGTKEKRIEKILKIINK